MKTALMGGALAFALWGGAALADGGNKEDKVGETPEQSNQTFYPERAEEAREGAPTVYEDSATGGSGVEESVEVEGQEWDTRGEPMGDEPQYGEDGQVIDRDVEVTGQEEGFGGAGETMEPAQEPVTEEPMMEPRAEPADEQTIIIEDRDDQFAQQEEQNVGDARGVTVLLGGGVEGYTGDLAPQLNAGPAWGVGVAFKPADAFGIELGYTGAVNTIDAGNVDVLEEADVIRHGGQALATVGLGSAGFQPYLLGGIGIDRYNVRDAEGSNFQDDTVGSVPVGLGFRTHIGDFTADLRGTYGFLFEQGFAPDEGRTNPSDVADGNTPTGRYGAALRLGATF